MARNRAGYPRSYTRRDILADRSYADPTLMEAVCACTLDGRPFGDEPVRVRTPSPHETRFAPKDTEFEIAARALVRLGERGVAFTSGERPDWRVQFADGRIVGLEITEVNPSATFTNRVEDLRIALREAIDAESALPLNGCWLTFNFGPRAFGNAPVEQFPLGSQTRRAVVRELLNYLRAGSYAKGAVTDALFPTLIAHDINVHYEPSGPPYVNFDIGATSFSPMGAFRTALDRANTKLKLASGYAFPHPLWLVLEITDMLGVFTESVEAFAGLQLSSGPFERVIISDGRAVRYLDRS